MQFTYINGETSDKNFIEFEVSQGSVLGPLLILIYINDIKNIPDLKNLPKLFTVDTSIFISSKNLSDLTIKCQTVINKISEWVLANRLTLNTGKTYYLIFNPSQLNTATSIPDFKLF